MGSTCGASWAFSAIEAIESAYLIASNTSYNLSIQQLLDCTAGGCGFGTVATSLYYINSSGILPENKYYAYLGYDFTICRTAAAGNTTRIRISTYVPVLAGCSNILAALALRPVPVLLDATNWMNYESGIMGPTSSNGSCGGYQPNFYALLVGVNSTAWTLRNSWSDVWGVNGYIALAPGNSCYICNSNNVQPVL